MKIALAQINPTIGDCESNSRKIQQAAENAARQGASVVVCPELSICGYPPQDLLDTPSFVDENRRAVERLAKAFPKQTLVVGFVDRNPAPTGRPFFNAAALLKEGRIAGVYHKQLLPNYDIFDEERYFEPGKPSTLVFEEAGERFGIILCEDCWNLPGFLTREYAAQPLAHYRDLDWLINLSASPFHLQKPEIRNDLFAKVTQTVKAPMLFCNQVGANDDLIFDGGSGVIEPSGKWIARAKAFDEDLVLFDTKQKKGPLAPQSTDWAEVLVQALTLGIRDYVRKCSGKGVCLGLSGGIDSSVVAALAAQAIGPEKVVGVLLPTRFTASQSTQQALELAKRLKIRTRTLPMEDFYKTSVGLLETGLGKITQKLTLENIQPRLRMVLLMAVANEEDLFLLNTSNKSEIACGYSTLYGDHAGILSVLGDLTKDQVYALARYLNRNQEIIPSWIIDRPPTAELYEGQKDEDSLPPYSILDPMVRAAVEKNADGDDLRKQFPASEVDKFLPLYRRSEYKRRQFGPILRVSSHAFGRGRRIPVASKKPWD